MVQTTIINHDKQGKLIAAICAGTKVLSKFQIGFGKKITTYPKYKDMFVKDYNFTGARVECDGNLITSQGPGTAFEFGLKIVEYLFGKDKVVELADMLRVNNYC